MAASTVPLAALLSSEDRSGEPVHPTLPLRPRRALAITVVAWVMLIQLATELTTRESVRIVARLAFMACEVPLLLFALTTAFAWSLRRRRSAAHGLAVGMAIATGMGCVFGLLYAVVARHVPELRLHWLHGTSFTRSALFGILNAQLYFGVWALAFVYPYAVESARVRALEAQQLRSRAEVARLRAHLEPHFLLNTLNAIAGLVTEQPREARRLLVCLGDLLRNAMQDASELQSLEKQVAWLRRYAEIMEARHRGVLRFRWEVPEACGGAMLPRLLLQPLVENAVKHGALRRHDGGGEVSLRASTTDDGTLVCVVEDNGPGMLDADIRDGAFGLQAVRRRLALETPRASLRFESSGSGTRSIVEIPTASPEG
ncbi:MAG: histidine kinase [Myxococcales bacterium]|nr:histidine kinase [Myxococcales bacterium]